VTTTQAAWSWTPAGWASTVLMAESGHLGKGRDVDWAEGGAEWHQSNPSWCLIDSEQGKGKRNQGSDQKFTQGEAAGAVWTVLVRADLQSQICQAFTPIQSGLRTLLGAFLRTDHNCTSS